MGVDQVPGLHKTRLLMGQQGLQPRAHSKRRKVAAVTPRVMLLSGRRVQIDATQVELQGGQKRWIYSVKDVESQVCLGLYPTVNLSRRTARQVLQAAIRPLVEVSSAEEPVVIQSDGRSDFTNHAFQGYSREVGVWIRSKVSQGGGMGILKRMYPTLKYDYLFRHEVSTDHDV